MIEAETADAHSHGHGSEDKHEWDLGIQYNGLTKVVEISRDATVKTLLERSIAAFGNLPNAHTLALWTAGGVELTNEQQTLKDAKLKNKDELLLRPSAVKGG